MERVTEIDNTDDLVYAIKQSIKEKEVKELLSIKNKGGSGEKE